MLVLQPGASQLFTKPWRRVAFIFYSYNF